MIPPKGGEHKSFPAFIYGSAWKGESTADLVVSALEAGYRAIDTAAQPRHYREELVGEALRKGIRQGVCRREDVFVYPPPPFSLQ